MSLSIRGPSPVEMFDNPPWSDAPFPRTPFETAAGRDRWQRPYSPMSKSRRIRTPDRFRGINNQRAVLWFGLSG